MTLVVRYLLIENTALKINIDLLTLSTFTIMKTKQFILLTAAMFLFLTVNPQKGYCGWDNQSGDLPGTVNLTPYLIAGGVVITGVITYLIIKKNKKNKSTSYSIGDSSGSLLASALTTENDSFYEEMKKASQKSSVEVFTGNSTTQMAYNVNTGLSVGLRFKF